jgi:putative RNA 2'-phosphotransferase
MNLNEKETRSLSKFLSLVLRHQPDKIGITLDDAGWTSVERLLDAMQKQEPNITREKLDHVVATNDKQRFAYSDDGVMIRARQGHSIEVELGYESAQPPEFLLHGTPTAAVEGIRREGLILRPIPYWVVLSVLRPM